MTEEWLQQNALWIIMDPWCSHPFNEDRKILKEIDYHNFLVAKKIFAYIEKLKHVKVSVILNPDNGDKRYTVWPKLSHLQNFFNKPAYTIAYMKKNNLNNIVYCGFHYGLCILNRPDGAKNMSKYYKIWVKKDLSCFFAKKPLYTIEQADQLTEQYATII